MAHCKESDLADISELLKGCRENEALKEKSFGCFYHKGKGVLHFHIKDQRRFAHVWTGKKWIEVDIATSPSLAKQRQLLRAVLSNLPIKISEEVRS